MGCGALVVRPDVVAWADGLDPDRGALSRAAARWFGSATAWSPPG
ncbi:hypothetical protein AB0D38_02740 [Streptomyces sp. NPDC048279]